MTEQELKTAVAANISSMRKELGLTQLELAEKLNYSDKAVSKWERAESLPDIYILTRIAELFGVTLDELIRQSDTGATKKSPSRERRKVITALSVGLVWLAASVIFFVLKMADFVLFNPGLVFLFALPMSFIVSVVFSRMWWGLTMRAGSVSGLVWSIAAAIVIACRGNNDLGYIFIIAAIMQVLTALWFYMKLHPGKNRR